MGRTDVPGVQFASDNAAGVCPEVWRALEEANRGHALSYGDDAWTTRACDRLRDVFERDCDVFFVFTGTAANALSLASLGGPGEGVLCHAFAHVETGESGATTFFGKGLSLLPVPGALCKLEPESVERTISLQLTRGGSKPSALSISQATELGTVYTGDELAAITASVRRRGLRVHMDGARFANAVASLGRSPADLSWRSGVDVLSLGNTKNGGLMGEAVVFFERELAAGFAERCKRAGQLGSKLRFVAASWLAMLEDGTWLRHAAHANAMARKLHAELVGLPGVKILFPVETNAVFAQFPGGALTAMRELGWSAPRIFGDDSCRLMCGWNTTPDDVGAFVHGMRGALASTL